MIEKVKIIKFPQPKERTKEEQSHRIPAKFSEKMLRLLVSDWVVRVEQLLDHFAHDIRVADPGMGETLGRRPAVDVRILHEGLAQDTLSLKVKVTVRL